MAEGDVLIRRTAVEVVELLRQGEITPSELIDAALARPRMRGSPSTVFAVIWPALSALPGSAKYQASRSG